MASEVEIKNIGPVEHLSFRIPERGGVVVFQGRNGLGKTKTIEAVETALTGRGKLEVRDGALKGEVKAFGVKITVGRSSRRTGELEVTSLEGRLSVAELVDPGLKSPEAADAKRIKALVQLSGVEASPELFYPLVGGRDRFEALVSDAAIKSDDLVVMAERVKRDLEASARKEESNAEHADGRARGAREAVAGINIQAESDSVVLQKELEQAIREDARLKSESAAEMKASFAAEIAREKLKEAESNYTGPKYEDACAALHAAASEHESLANQVRALEESLRTAKQQLQAAQEKSSNAAGVVKLAEQHMLMIREWKEQIEAAIPESPSAAELVAAGQRVAAARLAVEAGALARNALNRLKEADNFAQQAVEHRQAAESLREAARLTDDVLSGVVSRVGSRLRVEAGRLVLNTKRGTTYFADLSHGERWKMALDIAIDAVGTEGVLTIPQEAWEGCDDFAREAIVEHTRERGVVALTAECSRDDEIVANVLE